MNLSNLKPNSWSFLPVFFLVTWPPLSIFTLIVAFSINFANIGFKRASKLYLISLACFSIIILMSLLSSTYNGEGILDAKNFKFFFYLVALTYGYSLSKIKYKLAFFISYYSFSIFLIFQYLLFGWSSDVRSNSLFYLPDQNNSMIIISFLFPVVLALSSNPMRFLVICLTMVCMSLIGSRAGFALVTLVFVFYTIRELGVIQRLFLSFFTLALLFYQGINLDFIIESIEFDSYSDQVRLTLWQVGIDEFFSKDNLLFGMGYDFFGIYNNYLDNEMKHVHNIYLQVLFTSGLLGGSAILVFFSAWVYYSLKQGNITLFLQVLVVIALGMVETVYSDSRVFVVICFFFGLSYRNFISEDSLE